MKETFLKYLRLISLNKVLPFLMILSVLSLVPNIFEREIIQGQIWKQIEQAEAAKSFVSGETEGFFPIRHYLEVYHKELIPWAAEFPIYTLSAALVNMITGIPIVISGRIISFIFFLLLLLCAYKLGILFGKDTCLYIFLPLFFSLFTVFRLYSISFMPDLPMAALCLWGIYFAVRRKWFLAAAVLSLASLFKYYGAFTALGLIFYLLLSKNEKGRLFGIIALILSPIPAILYLFFVFKLGIPNPIIEYKNFLGGNHLANLGDFLSIKLYLRALTWIFIKNPTLLGGLAIISGFIFVLVKKTELKKSELRFVQILLCQLIAGALFVFAFIKSFHVHDYYGLQIALVTTCFACLGMVMLRLVTQGILRRELLLMLILTAFFALSLISTRSAMVKQNYYLDVSNKLKEWTAPNEKVLIISDLNPHAIVYNSGRTAWVLRASDWERFKGYTERRLKLSELAGVLVFLRSSAKDTANFLSMELHKLGWNEVSEVEYFPSTHKKVPATIVWFIKKNGNTDIKNAG